MDPVPSDDRMPGMRSLLDPPALEEMLSGHLGKRDRLVRATPVAVRYKPGRRAFVQIDVVSERGLGRAVAIIDPKRDLERAADLPHLAEGGRGRTIARRPLVFEPEPRALVQWEPVDVGLPLMMLGPRELAAALDLPPEAGRAQFGLLGHTPLRRAVLRLGAHVLKLYGSESKFREAAEGMRAASAAPGIPTAELVGVRPGLLITVQRAIEGRPPEDDRTIAPEAGAIVRSLHAAPAPPAMPEFPPALQLEAAARSVAVVASLRPALGVRARDAVSRLAASAPAVDEAVLSHGDFEAGQLVVSGGAARVVDLDQACRSARAFDLATYAATALEGEPGDLARARSVLACLLEGYGGRAEPADLDWWLATAILCRASSPFRKLRPDWAARTERFVEAAEALLDERRAVLR